MNVKYKVDTDKLKQEYRNVNGGAVDDIIKHYNKEPSTLNPDSFLSLLKNESRVSDWFKSTPSYFRLVSFFEDLEGKPISIYHRNYFPFVRALEKQFEPNFVVNKGYCNPGEMPNFSAVLTNHPAFQAYPFQVLMGREDPVKWEKHEHEVSIIKDYLDLMTDKVIPLNFVFPKKSNAGAPSLLALPEVKTHILETSVRNFEVILDLLDDSSDTTKAIGNAKRFDILYNEYSISCIATQGSRIQNDRHGTTGKTRTFKQYGHIVSTIVDITDIKGTFARRSRVVVGLNYGVNCLTNLVLAPIRNYYYKTFFHTYKVQSQAQLDDEFKNCVFIFGVDVTQLDNNTSGERVDLYCNTLISNVLSDKFLKGYKKLFKMSTHPAIFFRPSSYDLGFYCNGNPRAVSDEDLDKNLSVGIPSGISATSELGKIEVTSYFLIQIFNVSKQYNVLCKDKLLLNAFKNFINKCLANGSFNMSKNELFSNDLFESPVSKYSDYKEFIFNFLNNHCAHEFVIKNTGDDTVLGCHPKYLFFFFCLMCFTRKGNPSPSSELFSSLPLVNYDTCNWHKIDAEEPLSYLGNLLYKVNNTWRFMYNPASFIVNTLLPEYDINAGGKKYTWGLGYLSRCEVYRNNPYMDDVIKMFETTFAQYFRTERCSVIAKIHMDKHNRDIDNTNLADKIFEDNPDSIYYKIDVKDLSPGVFEKHFAYLPLNNMLETYKKMFKPEKLILSE